MTDLRERLRAEFPPAAHSSLSKGGRNLTYVPIAEYIVRLNEVLGLGEWGYEVLSVLPFPADDPRHIVAHVRLHALGQTFDGMGGQAPNRNKAGDILDLGDDFKGAVSDALKKASSHLEVGLYLSRKEGALQAEEDAKPKPVRADHRTHGELRTAASGLSAASKVMFAAWMAENGLPKFSKDDVLTIGQVASAYDEIGRLTVEAARTPVENAGTNGGTQDQEPSRTAEGSAPDSSGAGEEVPDPAGSVEPQSAPPAPDPLTLLQAAGMTTIDTPEAAKSAVEAARARSHAALGKRR